MDDSVQISEETRNKIYRELTDLMLRALEAGAIEADDAQDASHYILERLDSITDPLYLEAFLEEVAERWNCFQPILLEQKAKAEEEAQKENIQQIQNEILNSRQ